MSIERQGGGKKEKAKHGYVLGFRTENGRGGRIRTCGLLLPRLFHPLFASFHSPSLCIKTP